MASNVLVVRLEKKANEKIVELSRKRRESKSDMVRKALLKYVQGESEADELKQVVARKFAEGKVSFNEMVRILGYDEAKIVAFFVDVAEKSLKEGI